MLTKKLKFLVLVPQTKFSTVTPMLSYGSITVASVLKELCDVKVIDSNSYRRTYTNKVACRNKKIWTRHNWPQYSRGQCLSVISID